MQSEADAEFARNATLPPLQSVMELTSAWRAPERNADPDAVPSASPGAAPATKPDFYLTARPWLAHNSESVDCDIRYQCAVCALPVIRSSVRV